MLIIAVAILKMPQHHFTYGYKRFETNYYGPLLRHSRGPVEQVTVAYFLLQYYFGMIGFQQVKLIRCADVATFRHFDICEHGEFGDCEVKV